MPPAFLFNLAHDFVLDVTDSAFFRLDFNANKDASATSYKVRDARHLKHRAMNLEHKDVEFSLQPPAYAIDDPRLFFLSHSSSTTR